jgi:ACR3 family arsenite efflux pump ArsB
MRDSLTMAGGFTVPPIMSAALTNKFGFDKKRSDKIAQLASPAVLQIVCTPLHLLALNMYNEKGVSVAHRAATVRKTLVSSTIMRMIRFSVAYGVGVIVNKYFIRHGKEWAERTYC